MWGSLQIVVWSIIFLAPRLSCTAVTVPKVDICLGREHIKGLKKKRGCQGAARIDII